MLLILTLHWQKKPDLRDQLEPLRDLRQMMLHRKSLPSLPLLVHLSKDRTSPCCKRSWTTSHSAHSPSLLCHTKWACGKSLPQTKSLQQTSQDCYGKLRIHLNMCLLLGMQVGKKRRCSGLWHREHGFHQSCRHCLALALQLASSSAEAHLGIQVHLSWRCAICLPVPRRHLTCE